MAFGERQHMAWHGIVFPFLFSCSPPLSQHRNAQGTAPTQATSLVLSPQSMFINSPHMFH
ncbi:hypothetical protein P152DRAFT_216922 [Eremomyces bilateralis CBS 781.70]|uniref:Uncharacterized protein n=1 Tax=Eremomyces bilateralis CBS 781.70 TaxID=1392243 RepID=A0A6G1FS64_9PEZI|nr:uncharacterized protein P152DRAFT_216922 [Eremomyces bilateralis CBS 781.70]KAF1808560.1 hypothetical protein P152DRAFT_216922 [Eremomyces bilateralis CBS 781.70]